MKIYYRGYVISKVNSPEEGCRVDGLRPERETLVTQTNHQDRHALDRPRRHPPQGCGGGLVRTHHPLHLNERDL